MNEQVAAAKVTLHNLIEQRQRGRINLEVSCMGEVDKWLDGMGAKYAKYQPNFTAGSGLRGVAREIDGLRVEVETGNFFGAFTVIHVSPIV